MSLEEIYRSLLSEIGEDTSREGLRDTPRRAAESIRYLCQGYQSDPEQIAGQSVYESAASDMVLLKDIELYSLCEHHLLPFIGRCHVAYLPDGKVIGISKIARIVDIFARRLQIQENLTRQIADCILSSTSALGVGVVIEAQHLCMMMRGVEKQRATMTTSCVLGEFHDDAATRAEFFSLIR